MVTSGEGWLEGLVREFGIDIYTLLYLKWITNSRITYCRAHGTLLNVMWQPGCEGRMGENGYMYIIVESFCYLSETITTFLISYTPISNKKFKKDGSLMVSLLNLSTITD